ncbi:adenosylcobyric acid synthase (glutamine-hydrolysing) [Balneicella halophila]|uniref:Cobyric acid synthase n=1 Tax=Balneicella halophila TaxID=1537566 RepID=A0A7L4UNK4_BALHA|nr:cobyric acid synthase [Balneicella halophila]PVX50681.1 adenosylcobyric acid synthase (glutamine-hydrolysing) [Balneicella halophila]
MNQHKLHPIFFAGTGSNVGKSLIAAAFCRIFYQDGYKPAPFKAQNMSLNSYATPEGLEIGRAQAVQAEAAKVPCHTDMNPILLKPTGEKMSQVVLNGKPAGNQNAYQYFKKEGREQLRVAVHKAFDRLNARYNPIVMEGAGSISELNLRDTDLVNMPMAMYAKADVILVADIDRGGVFASVYGSIALLSDEERKHVKGIIINKFRGDIRLFEQGKELLESLCKVPVLGIIPYFTNIYIEDEDSVALENKFKILQSDKVNVVVVLLKHLSNFTDFQRLERDDRVNLFYSNKAQEIKDADIIIIPGSKNTIADLYELRKNGLAKAISQSYRDGKTILGICGGYQMMGQSVKDPVGVEGTIKSLPGLGMLPMETTLTEEKLTRQVEFKFLNKEEDCQGYEIHMGTTQFTNDRDITSLNKLNDGTEDGCFISPQCFGSYIHGILDNAVVIDYLLERFDGLKSREAMDYQAFKEEQYEKLAHHVRKHTDVEKIYQILKAD